MTIFIFDQFTLFRYSTVWPISKHVSYTIIDQISKHTLSTLQHQTTLKSHQSGILHSLIFVIVTNKLHVHFLLGYCGNFPPLEGGRIDYPRYRTSGKYVPNDNVYFTCYYPRVRRGPSRAKCQVTGQWDIEQPPTCDIGKAEFIKNHALPCFYNMI